MNFNFIGKYDVSNIKNIVNNFNISDWNEYTKRQEVFETHKNTKTIRIIWSDPIGLDEVKPGRYHTNYKFLKNDLFNIENIINNKLKGRIESVLLIKLDKNTTIPIHKDGGGYLAEHNRIHLPIITDPKCMFTVGNETIHLKEGELWEINNNEKTHGVDNKSNIDRVHMLIDWKRL